ncbi:cupin domain-containing protein [Bhargavaea ginsengi]|uniref:cupin domain-containing protein n=1 Tax=Bhargavaea ginsengi TaxID=426757 RepID=UPI003C73333E
MDHQAIKAFQQFDDNRFTKVDFMKNENSTAFTLNFLPGQSMKAHSHPGKELYLVVTEGSGTFTVDGEEVMATRGDVLFCDEKEMIGFENNGDNRTTLFGTLTKIG